MKRPYLLRGLIAGAIIAALGLFAVNHARAQTTTGGNALAYFSIPQLTSVASSALVSGDLGVVYQASTDTVKTYDITTQNIANLSTTTLTLGGTAITATAADINTIAGGATKVVNVTTAGALTAAGNAGKITTVNSAAGIPLTLPAATGTGNIYTLFIGTTVTSIGTTIATIGSDKIAGNAYQTGATGAATAFLASGSGTTVTLNGTTKGGIKGDVIKFRDVSSGLYNVEIEESITSSAATPFS